MAHIRPPHPHPGFEGRLAMPEVAERSVGTVAMRGMGLGIKCLACGRFGWFTPVGIRTALYRYQRWPVERFVAQCVCETCGARECLASGVPLEKRDDPRPYVLYRAVGGGARQDGP